MDQPKREIPIFLKIPGVELTHHVETSSWKTLFLGKLLQKPRYVFVEVLHTAVCDDPAAVDHFLRRCAMLAQLRHPAIHGALGSGEVGKYLYLVQEFPAGCSRLADFFATDPRPFKPLLAVAKVMGVAQALQFAHAKGFVHGQIRPSNIFITKDHLVKLRNFGLYRHDIQYVSAMTRRRPHYCAPEHITFKEVDARTDLYCLGVILYQLLAGEPPYNGGTPEDIWNQHLKAPIPSLLRIYPHGNELEGLTYGLLAKKPSQRPADIKQVIEVLGRVMHALPEPEKKPRPPADETVSLMDVRPIARTIGEIISKKKPYLHAERELRSLSRALPLARQLLAAPEAGARSLRAPLERDASASKRGTDRLPTRREVALPRPPPPGSGFGTFVAIVCCAILVAGVVGYLWKGEATYRKQVKSAADAAKDDARPGGTPAPSVAGNAPATPARAPKPGGGEVPMDSVAGASAPASLADRKKIEDIAQLADSDAEDAAARLEAYFADPSEEIRKRAHSALSARRERDFNSGLAARGGGKDEETAAPALKGAEDEEKRLAHVRELAAKPGGDASELLVLASQDQSLQVRREALRALGHAKPEEALPVLLKAARSAELAEAVLAALREGGPAAARALADRLEKGGEGEAAAASALLGELADAQAVPALEKALRSTGPQAYLAGLALGRLGVPGREALLRCLKEDAPRQRWTAFCAWRETANEAEAAALAAQLKEFGGELQRPAQLWLTSALGPGSMPDDLTREEAQWVLRRALQDARPARAALAAALLGRFPEASGGAGGSGVAGMPGVPGAMDELCLAVLAASGPEAVPALVEAFKKNLPEPVLAALIDLAGRRPGPELLPALTSLTSHRDLGEPALAALLSYGELAVGAVMKADFPVEAKARWLTGMQGPVATEALGALLQGQEPAKARKIFEAAVEGGRLGSEAAGRLLLSVAGKEEIAKALLKAIADTRQPSYRNLLTRYLTSESPALRKMAMEGLAALPGLSAQDWLEFYRATHFDDAQMEVLDLAAQTGETSLEILGLAARSAAPRLRARALRALMDMDGEAPARLLLERFPAEEDKKLRADIARHFSKEGRPLQLEFHLLLLADPSKTFAAAGEKYLSDLPPEGLNRVAEKLREDIPVAIKQTLVDILLKKNYEFLANRLADLLPARDAAHRDLLKRAFAALKKEAWPALEKALNNPAQSEAARGLLDELRVAYTHDAKTGRYTVKK